MKPTIENLQPVADADFDALEAALGVALPARLRDAARAVNGGRPSPCDVPCKVYSGETHVPVYEFVRWDQRSEYADLCLIYWNDLLVPKRFVVFAVSDADVFFVDVEDPGLRVMYFQYVEGDYVSHFGEEGEMDLVSPTLEGFLESFEE